MKIDLGEPVYTFSGQLLDNIFYSNDKVITMELRNQIYNNILIILSNTLGNALDIQQTDIYKKRL